MGTFNHIVGLYWPVLKLLVFIKRVPSNHAPVQTCVQSLHCRQNISNRMTTTSHDRCSRPHRRIIG
jgi:hypothetical protein